MTAIEIKSEIKRKLDELPEGVLVDILDLINVVKLSSLNDPAFSNHLKRIITEDRELLQNLAQ